MNAQRWRNNFDPCCHTNLVWNEICLVNSFVAFSHVPSLADKSGDTGNVFLHNPGLSEPLCDNNLPTLWLRCGFSGGRAGEELGVITGDDDNELLLVESLGDAGKEWTCSEFGPLIQGWAKICSRVGLSLGFSVSIQEMSSLASTENKGWSIELSKLCYIITNLMIWVYEILDLLEQFHDPPQKGCLQVTYRTIECLVTKPWQSWHDTSSSWSIQVDYTLWCLHKIYNQFCYSLLHLWYSQ